MSAIFSMIGCLFLLLALPGGVIFVTYLVIKTLAEESAQRRVEANRQGTERESREQTWPPPPQGPQP